MTIIEGNFKRLSKRKHKPLGATDTSIGASVWEWLHPGAVQTENVILTGTNLPTANDVTLLDRFEAEYRDAVAKLDDANNKLNDAETNLLSIQVDVFDNGTGDEQAQWQSAYDRVIAAQATRDSALATVQQVADWTNNVKSALGLSGLHGLGILPAIPWSLIGLIVAAAAALYAIANFANTFFNQWQINRWNQENMQRQANDLPPLTGSPTLADTSSGVGTTLTSIFGSATDITKYLLIGLIAFFVLPPLLRSLESK